MYRVSLRVTPGDLFISLKDGNLYLFQEGFRYNALHCCAMKNQAGAAQLLLDILENPDFYKLLYPQDKPETTTRRMEHMLDLYLNMPDKGVSLMLLLSVYN